VPFAAAVISKLSQCVDSRCPTAVRGWWKLGRESVVLLSRGLAFDDASVRSVGLSAVLVMELLSHASISPGFGVSIDPADSVGPLQRNESLVVQRGRNRDLPRSQQERPTLGYLNRMDRPG